ncbi:hypothetical protein EB796_000380 [Bugula neritina]|uniref:Uncharacterized protein n=1 Tax=Bugula neritina TaxID=10212 RepID=A0A7J7KT89_BUGNE|nr:hypothetical protein EB796_000380 [Bugula neritina]
MSQLGFNFISKLESHADSANSSQSLEDIINSVTHFRERVRSFALGGDAANATDEEKSLIRVHRDSHSALLDSTDQLRDKLAATAGIIIKDAEEGPSTWHMIEKTSDGPSARE